MDHGEAVSALEIKLGHYIQQPQHISMDGKPLDSKLVEFDEKCEKNKQTYYETYPDITKLERVFITPDDRTNYYDIKNKTKTEIQQCLLNLIKVCD